MELIERYLSEVGRRLPPKNRDDILKELRSLIGDKLEERVPEGQPTRADVIEVLKAMGAPKKIAASFAGERYLIGPGLYPRMMQILRIVLAALLVLPVLGLWEMLNTDFASIGAVLNYALDEVAGYFSAALTAFATIVIVFAWLEWLDVRMPEEEEKWDPSDLPPVSQSGRFDYLGASLELSGNFVLVAFLTYFLQQGGIPFFTNPEAPSRVLPISAGLIVPMMIAIILQIALELYVIYHGRWQVVTIVLDALFDLAGLYYAFAIFSQVAMRITEYVPVLRSFGFDQWVITPVFTLIAVLIVVDHVVKLFKLLTSGESSATIKAHPA